MKKDIALYLGSGGARGYAHIGVIRELERQGYNIKFISGSSMGALIGGLYASGKLDIYEEWVLNLDPIDILKLVDFSFKKGGVIEGEKVFNIIADMIGNPNIEELSIPYVAVATDIKSKQPYYFTKGSLVEAIRASIAIPTLFTPVIKNEMVLVDGGLCNPLGIIQPTDSNLYTIAVDLSGDKNINKDFQLQNSDKNKFVKKIHDFFQAKKVASQKINSVQIIQDSIETMQKIISDAHLEKIKPDLTIFIPGNLCQFYEFHKAEEVIYYGTQSAKSSLLKSFS
ncbi:patatin-like phospholipase family protein [Sulfurimonas sp. C5]|uniref:patatin-like phospholipase family protein n=1 Tax=Sulfurimonas sp. C5 TaxID=3036947 RepID=UPI002453978E|nr:patatin-like phospholipase family protein [Sulfurimonas sp. C5]MDH4943890.1 patatin-like phospholipase family protein [Sulfurimonas sp. C5]